MVTMSAPIQPGVDNSIAFLDTDWKLATVYVAFIEPKTQQDAVRFIYGKRKPQGRHAPVITQPVQWITDAREELMAHNFLIRTDNKLRGSIIKANNTPILRSLQDAGAENCHLPDVMKGAEMVLDSPWFRSFFSYTMVHSPMTYADGTVYEPYRNLIKIINEEENTKKLEIKGFQNRLFQLLSEIGYYNHNIRYLMQSIGGSLEEDGRSKPVLARLLQEPDFLTFVLNNDEEIPPYFIEIFTETVKSLDIRYLGVNYCERLFTALLNNNVGVYMPEEISILFRSSPCMISVRPLDMGYLMKKFYSKYHHKMYRHENEQSNTE